MSRKISFNGQTFVVPDDASDDEITQIAGGGKPPAPPPNAGLAPPAGGPKPSTILNAPEESGLETGPLISPHANENEGLGPTGNPGSRFMSRFMNSAGQALNPVTQIPAMFHAAVDKPADSQQAAEEAGAEHPNVPPVLSRFLYRTAVKPVANAVEDYANGRVTPEAVLNNAAEGLGTGAGTVIGGKLLEEIPGAVAKSPVGTAVKGAAKASGIGLSSIEKLTKSAGPSVRDANFPQALETAAPELARQNATTPVKSVQAMADAAHTGADSLWKNQIEPQITRNANATIDAGQIAKQIRSGIDEGMADLFPEQAKAANAFADKFNGQIPLSKANSYLKTLNAQLKGFYKMSPEARAAAGVTDGRISSMENAADGLRQQMYDKLDSLGETDPAGLRQQYGALKQVQDVFRKRAIVSGRQAPLNLQQIIGLAGGAGEAAGALASGHPAAALGGVTAAAVPTILKYINSPDMLVQRGISGLKLPEALTPPPAVEAPGVPRSLGAAAAAPAAEEVPGILRGPAGLERRATPRLAPMSATELEAAMKQRKPIQTPFDVTQGAMDTINNDPAMQKIAQEFRQGGHAGGGVASVEELNRPGTNYMVSKHGKLTYHGKEFAPENTPEGAAHVTVLPDGTLRVNAGNLTPTMERAIENGIKK